MSDILRLVKRRYAFKSIRPFKSMLYNNIHVEYGKPKTKLIDYILKGRIILILSYALTMDYVDCHKLMEYMCINP